MHLTLAEIPIAAIAVLGLSPRERRRLEDAGHTHSLEHVQRFLHLGRDIPILTKTFNTEVRRLRLEQAFRRFCSGIQSWNEGNQRPSQFNWLLTRTQKNAIEAGELHPTDFLDALLLRVHRDSAETAALLRSLARLQYAQQWLPYVSLQGTQQVSKFSRADVSLFQSTIGRAMIAQGHRPLLRPWQPEFPREFRAMPVHWLYAFAASQRHRLLTLLQRLHDVGYRNVGHLAILSPHLHPFLKGVNNRRAWRTIFTAVRNAT